MPDDGCGLQSIHEAVCQAGEITQESWDAAVAMGMDAQGGSDDASQLQPAPAVADSALHSLAEVAERHGSAVASLRHAADSAHYSTATWPGMDEWLCSNVGAVRALVDDLAAWCDRMDT